MQRSREETDRRRVTLRYGGETADLAREFFAPLGERMDDLFADRCTPISMRYAGSSPR